MDEESVRWKPCTDPEPDAPLGFEAGQYILPVHQTKLLELKHPSEMDKRIVFKEKPHIYVIDGVPYRRSVTWLASLHGEEFNEEEAIQKMKSSFRESWPKLKYAKDATVLETAETMTSGGYFLAVECDRTIFAGKIPEGTVAPHEFICDKARRKYKGGELTFYSFSRAMKDIEIKEAWELNRMTCTHTILLPTTFTYVCGVCLPQVPLHPIKAPTRTTN